MNENMIDGEEQKEMSFLEHLEVLRWHLIRSVLAIVLVAIGAFVYKEIIFDTIIFAPKSENFITFRWLCSLSAQLHSWFPFLLEKDGICIGKNIPDLQNITMAGQFTTHILVAVVAGIIFAFPYVFWEIWRFVKPGLRATEQSKTRGVVFFCSALFITGVLFGYFIISPLSVNFFATYNISEQVINNPTLSTYITTVTTVLLACGFVFELPVVMYFLTKAGIVTPSFLKRFRKHAFVGALILSAIITPPDVFSQLLVCIPLFLLYEISIFISRIVLKRDKDILTHD